MCGIAGIISEGPQLDPLLIQTMAEALRHRGPDGAGFAGWWPEGRVEISTQAETLHGARVLLAHRRLAIIDPTPAAEQPFRAGGCITSWNGEIYNYRELAGPNHAGGDTAVAAALLASQWSQALAAFRGMYAISCLDLARGRLLLARDPFGIKPLYLARWRDGLAFASEPGALLTLPGIARQVDLHRLREFLVDGAADYGARTFFSGLRQLPPGDVIDLDLHQATCWPVSVPAPTRATGEPVPLRDLLERSVALHLRSDAPLGFACSGGLDSSAIIGLARRLEPDRPFHAIAFDDGEMPWIRLAATANRCDLHVVAPADTTAAEALDGFLEAQGEPPLSASMLAEYLVYRRAGEVGLKVLLDGQGADELFAGYDWFLGARIASLLQQGRIGGAVALTCRAPLGRRLRLRTIVADAWRAWIRSDQQRYHTMPQWIRGDGFPVVDMSSRGCSDPFRNQIRLSLSRDTLPTFLRSADRSAMAHGIENRVPFLMPEIAAYAHALPADGLLDRAGVTKAALRSAVRDIVPEPILLRRDKVGFTCPEDRWLRASATWIRDTINDPIVDRQPWLLTASFRAITRQFLDRPGPIHPAWWRTLVVLDWMRRRKIEA